LKKGDFSIIPPFLKGVRGILPTVMNYTPFTWDIPGLCRTTGNCPSDFSDLYIIRRLKEENGLFKFDKIGKYFFGDKI
jgi:hypothetical protein